MRLNLGDSVSRCYSYRLVEIAWMVLFLLLLLSLYCSIHSFIIFDSSRSEEKGIRPYTKRMENEGFEHRKLGKSSK